MGTERPQGGSSVQSEIGIVILGNDGDDKKKVVKSFLNCKNLSGVKVGLCTLHQCEQAGRRISVVEAPGWDRTSTQQTPENIKKEVERSVSLCPPGPHVLLLVIPVKVSEESSAGEITAAQTHIELLSERVWKHTILLFACDDGVKKPKTKENIHSTEKILEKCGRRYYVLQESAQIHELLEKIDDLVEENHGDFFIPQTYYELIQHKKQEVSGESGIRRRQGSSEINPPDLSRGDSVEAAKRSLLEDIRTIYTQHSAILKPIVVILMGIFGALIGAVAGAVFGVPGSCTGLVFGIIVGILLAALTAYNRIYIILVN